uniref:phospholipase A2 inhibitor subunit gamma B-like n=1 Tax=Podarcis muralis TaxID=64176 RepID=UPI00109F746F|nr:phospholipase A2 inhibitor subunit gamma B-like [Podarcis muralis]
MKIFLSTCLFLAILSEVAAVVCIVRKSKEKGTGRGVKTCVTTEGGNCFYGFTVSNLGAYYYDREQGCTTDCTVESYTFTREDGRYLRSFRSCCRSTSCGSLVGEKGKPKLNGRECPTCCPSLSKACKGSKTIKCNDDETQCIEFVVAHDNSSIPDEHFHGCASPKFCAMAKKSMHFDALSGTITRARCSDILPPLEELNFEE